MTIKINGSWFEFQHHNVKEGVYWNPAFRQMTAVQWENLVAEIAAAGMEYLVLLSVAQDVKAYYPSKLVPRFPMADPNLDLVETFLSACDKYHLKVFMPNDYFGQWDDMNSMFGSPEVRRLRDAATDEIFAMYGHHPSFYGWYLPNEAAVTPYFAPEFIQYVNYNRTRFRNLAPEKPLLIAPYGTCIMRTDDTYVKQLEQLDADIFAYQDEIGVQKADVSQTAKFFENLRKAHNKVGGKALWADVEVFEFEGKVYHSALLPAKFERVKQQLQNVAPFVDRILIYEYPGLINPANSSAYNAQPGAAELYDEYMKFIHNNQL